MTLLSRCIDHWGYCNSPFTPELVTSHGTDLTPPITYLANCKYNPTTCKHYRTNTQQIEPQQAGADERTG